MWKTKGTMVIGAETSLERLEEMLRGINVDDKETIERVREVVKVTSIGLPNGQILLMQLPGTSSCTYTAFGCVLIIATSSEDDAIGAPITSKFNLEYKDKFLHAHVEGNFVDDDFEKNDVVIDDGEVPEFVQNYEEPLGRKRRVVMLVVFVSYCAFDF